MSGAPDWFPWAFAALCFVVGWLKGALWHSQRHLDDLRSHIRWVEEYTANVNDLLDDLFRDHDEPTPPTNTEGETK